jgi:hypothetical protein
MREQLLSALLSLQMRPAIPPTHMPLKTCCAVTKVTCTRTLGKEVGKEPDIKAAEP